MKYHVYLAPCHSFPVLESINPHGVAVNNNESNSCGQQSRRESAVKKCFASVCIHVSIVRASNLLLLFSLVYFVLDILLAVCTIHGHAMLV
jgi:hypothetical protein